MAFWWLTSAIWQKIPHNYPSAERAKFKGIHLKYRNAKYPLYVEYFIEVLTPAAELSLHFQREAKDVVGAVRGIKSFFRIMGKLKESSALIFSTGRVKTFFDVVSSENTDDDHRQCTMYREVKLTHVEQAKSSLNNTNNDILSHILECFTQQFDKTNNLFNALVKVLDTEVYPEVGLVDDAYGLDEVRLLVERFRVLLTANGCDVEKIESEWDDVKEMVVTTGLKGTNYIDVWAKLFTSSKKEALSNILHLVEILLVVPVSNALLERMFSTMNRMHTDWRNCLGEKRVENLLRVWEEGTTADKFDPQPAVGRWSAKCAAQRRPNVMPSGSRAKASTPHSGSRKRKLPQSEVVETVKDLLEDDLHVLE